jgi:hypothetical protein
MGERKLTKKEKNKILTALGEGKDEVEKILDTIYVTKEITDNDVNEIKENIESFFSQELPRHLTPAEIKDIVSVIPPLPCTIREISRFNNRVIKEKISKQLSRQKFLMGSKPNLTIKMIKKNIYDSFIRSVVEPYSSVGSISGMSISERITQAMLDSIHSSGTKSNKEANFALIKGLIKMIKKPEILKHTVHFKDKNMVPEEIVTLGDMLKGINVSDFVIRSEILKKVPEDSWRWYRNYNLIHENSVDFEDIEMPFLRLHIDVNKCFLYDIYLEDLINVIKKNTEDDDFEETVTCIGSPLTESVIDIHGNKDYIIFSVNQFSNLGKRLEGCSDIKKTKDKGEIEQEFSELEIFDMTNVFLKVILLDCLSEMKVKGIDGVTDVYPAETINMNDTFTQKKEKGNGKLWNIKVRKKAIFFDGIPFSKIRKLFQVCGMKIIEDELETDYHLLIEMPKKRTEKYYNDDDKVEYLYELKDGKHFNRRSGEVAEKNYGPSMLINNLRNFEKEKLSREIVSLQNSKGEEFYSVLPEFSEIYRATAYSYAIVEGRNITKDLFASRIVDTSHLYPENARAMMEIFGIEGARFYLIRKYLSIKFIKEINPANIMLLVGFQTSFGILIPIRSTEIYKRGASVLAEASFERQSDVFKNASAFGDVDDISSVGSRVITGIPCRNGTGSVEVSFDPLYLADKNNKYVEDEEKEIVTDVNDEIVGACLNPGYYVLPKEDINAERTDDAMLLIQRDKKQVGGPKTKIPTPPRTRAPRSLSKKSSRKTTLFQGERINVSDVIEIPDAPQFEDDDDEF